MINLDSKLTTQIYFSLVAVKSVVLPLSSDAGTASKLMVRLILYSSLVLQICSIHIQKSFESKLILSLTRAFIFPDI